MQVVLLIAHGIIETFINDCKFLLNNDKAWLEIIINRNNDEWNKVKAIWM